MAVVGSLGEFQSETESFSTYVERTEMFFVANNIPANRKVAVFLSVIGAKTFGLLRNLVAPQKPSEMTFAQVTDVLKAHFEPTPVIITERFQFNQRNQGVGESVTEYVAELKRLAMHCDFRDRLEDSLRDRLVCGLRSSHIQRRLLSEFDLTYAKAVELATGMEAAERNAQQLKGVELPIQRMTQQSSAGNPTKDCGGRGQVASQKQSQVTGMPCHRCDRVGHNRATCKFKNATCYHCHKPGHLARACRKKKAMQTETSRPQNKPSQMHQVVEREDVKSEPMFTVGTPALKPITVHVQINGITVPMEVDTGAACTIMSLEQQRRLFPSVELHQSGVVLHRYTTEQLQVVGEMPVHLTYGEQQCDTALLIVAGDGPALLGRDWLGKIRLDWAQIAYSTSTPVSNRQALIDECKEVFKAELGTVKQLQAQLRVKEGAQSKFCHPRHVPLATRKAIDQEIDCLVDAGILTKVDYSEWAAPIVAVPKKDGNFCICGDYKVTINPVLEVDQHPLPLPEEIFASLAGGQKFTTLDLFQAYQQILLDESSRKLINTHKGLFQYTRLPFGVASASAIFQRAMGVVLQGIPNALCYLDDAIVTGVSDREHLSTLARVGAPEVLWVPTE